jgi:hypothetical protein
MIAPVLCNMTSGVKESERSVAVQAFLYDYYINELNWSFPDDNASGLKKSKCDGKRILVDDYDSASIESSLFYVEESKTSEIVASARICKADENNLLELERYEDAQRCLKPYFENKDELNIIELNREAILPAFSVDWRVYLTLLRKVFAYCSEHNYSILTTTNFLEWKQVYSLINFTNLKNCQFKYTDTDPESVDSYFAKHDTVGNIVNNIDLILFGSSPYDVKTSSIT